MPDKYEIRTQYIPALLDSVPFIALGFYYLGQLDTAFWSSVFAQTFDSITMAGALYFLAAFSCRHTGKWIEDRTFHGGKTFPTTAFLLEEDTNLSKERKAEIYNKVQQDFGISLVGKTGIRNPDKKRIHEAVGQIRKKFFKKNDLIHQRNIQFGFSKNLAGGALNALPVCLLIISLSLVKQSSTTLHIGLLLTMVYTLVLGYGLLAMKSNSKRYAHALFDEFVGS